MHLTVNLAGKRLALSFRPATQADEDTIASYLPEPPEGGEIDPSDLPDSLPGYLINLTAEFTVDGAVIETGPTQVMGTELRGELGYYFPNKGWDIRPKSIVAGEYQAVGLDLAGIAPSQLEQLKTDLGTVKAKLENNDPAGLTRHSLTGNLLQTGVTSYFALNDVQDQLAAQGTDVVAYRLPSFGTFSTNLKTDYYFGMPRNVSFPGILMDIDYLYSQVADHDNVQTDAINFMRVTGPRTSALEHLVPEEMFSTDESPANGISAVKAIALAQGEGQRVYTLNAGNLEVALIAINADAAVENEIRNAVNAGKEVSIHQNSINYYGWSGHGYIIIDPETGSGAYKISGGADGGELEVDAGSLISILGFLIGLFDSLLGAMVDAIQTLIYVVDALLNCSFPIGHFLAYFAIAFFAAALWFVIVGALLGFPIIGAVAAVLITLALGAFLTGAKDNLCSN